MSDPAAYEQVTLNVAPNFREHLQELAQRLRLQHDYQALEAALALMAFCSRELVERNAHFYVEYPNGERRKIELRRKFTPKVVED